MKNSTVLVSFITALSLHLIVGAIFLLGVDFSLPKDNKKEEVIINASVINQKIFDDLKQKKAQQVADKIAQEKRKADEARKRKHELNAKKSLKRNNEKKLKLNVLKKKKLKLLVKRKKRRGSFLKRLLQQKS